MTLWRVQIIASPSNPEPLNLQLVAQDEDAVFAWLDEKFPGYMLRSIGSDGRRVIVV